MTDSKTLIARKFETVILEELDAGILQITLNRPDVANALNTQMGLELRDIWLDLYRDYEPWRAIIITGSGDKAFCAGADLKERKGLSLGDWQIQHAGFEQMMLAMTDCPVPVIAAVNGAAYGGGCEIAMGADFCYAAAGVSFALPEVKLGLIPGAMGTQNIVAAVGLRRARELVLTGKPFGVHDAAEWGLVNKLCGRKELMTEVLEAAKTIASNAPIAVRQAKKAINVSTEVDLKSGYAFEIEAYNRVLPTQDRVEGIDAFNEKREPKFTNS